MAVLIFLAVSFVFALITVGPAGAVVVLIIQSLFCFFNFSKRSERNMETKIEKAYKTEKERNPDIKDSRVIEELVRRRLMRGKLKRVGMCFGAGVLLISVCSLVKNPDSFLYNLAVLCGASLMIVGVCSFAKAMHDPLTPDESRELARKDAVEKSGMSPQELQNTQTSARTEDRSDTE